MLNPTRMSRILVGGHQQHMDSVVTTLHSEGVIQLEDYQDPAGLTSMGSPMERGDEVSEMLVRVRGLQKAIDSSSDPSRSITTDDAVSLVTESEEVIMPLVNQLAEAKIALANLEGDRDAIAPFAGINVELDAIHTVRAVKVFAGTCRADPTEALQQGGVEYDLQLAKANKMFTVVVATRPDDAQAVERALAGVGFSASQLPNFVGTAADNLAKLDAQIATATAAVETAQHDVDGLREKAGGKLAALETMFKADVERTQAPLHFGVTDQTFHLEGWLPTDRLNHLQNVLAHQFGESLYVQDLGDMPRGHEDIPVEGDGDHHHEHGGHEVAVEDEPPTALNNKGPAGNYQFMLSLLAMPRYKELDPTKLIAIFFPIFFGLMVGDVVIGLFIVLIALWLRNNNLFGIGGNGVAKPMMWGGIWAILIGAFIFGEGLGMHFVLSEEAIADGEHSWESAFGVHFPTEGFIHKADGASHAAEVGTGAAAHAVQPLAEAGTAVSNPLAPHGGTHLTVNNWFNLGYYSKIHDVEALLLISVLIGFVHMVLGLVLGVRNVAKMHGVKLAIQEKVSWLGIIAASILIVLGITGSNSLMLYGGGGLFLVSVALLWMGVQHTIGVGFIAILEIPSLLGNLLSYTRLAAIGASKAGMAIAFATIGFELIGGPVGLIVYLLASLLITVLAILAGFLQSLRLQFVEFFSKFYTGGGRPYLPFGSRRA